MFRAPTGSSSPLPATPPRSNRFESSLFGGSDPSTTPAGPPPGDLTDISTTPAGPPPSSRLGISTASDNSLFKPTNSFSHHNVFNPTSRQPTANGFRDDDTMDFTQDDQDMMQGDFAPMPAPPPPSTSHFAATARSFATVPNTLVEPDDVVLGTEDILDNLFLGVKEDTGYRDIQARVAAAASGLDDLWRNKSPTPTQRATIGPGDQADPITKASWVSSLLLSIHHPGSGESRNAFGGLRLSSSRRPLPEVLLHWLQTHHNPFPRDFEEIRDFRPSPSANERYWDVVLSLVLRGQLSKASQLLEEGDFSYAITALDDGAEDIGYHGPQLTNVDRVISRAADVLQKCPAVESGDWNVTGAAWSNFRSRVHHAYSDLEQFAEGNSVDRDAGLSQSMSADHFNMPSVRSDDYSLSTMSRRAESKVPWSIYQNLQALYGQILGTRQENINSSSDWLEAVVGTTVWWDGDDHSSRDNLAASRRRQGRNTQIARLVDSEPLRAYQQQLASALLQISTEDPEPELQVNPTSAIEVALACIFENDLEGFIGIVRGWSPTIASAIVEVAGCGGWLGLMQIASDTIVDAFDESDLQVLQFAKKADKRLQKDDILSHYANLVSKRTELSANGRSREGWQLAIQILGRLDNQQLSNSHIGKLLDKLQFTDGKRVEQAVGLCNKLGLTKESHKLSEQYADHLLQEARNFGDAVLHYARAHQERKLKDLVNMLVSYCLVTSSAWPAASSLDSTLQTLLSSPQAALAQLRKYDTKASQLLGHHFAGYATVRRFYALRDDEPLSPEDVKVGSDSRKHAAARALIASISSAADSVNGGRFDESIESVLEVDGLLVLLGEALPFLTASSPHHHAGQQARILTQSQILALIKAAEDISTAPAAVLSQCEACLSSALGQANGRQVSVPANTFTKTLSGLNNGTFSTGNSVFSLIGSGSFTSGKPASSTGSSGVLVGSASISARKWDWRVGMAAGASGTDVLRIVRLGLARELSRCWLDI